MGIDCEKKLRRGHFETADYFPANQYQPESPSGSIGAPRSRSGPPSESVMFSPPLILREMNAPNRAQWSLSLNVREPFTGAFPCCLFQS
jgi:hypothetical protein